MKSGEKSLARYAVEESHQYFKEAFDLLSNKPARTKDEDALLIELLIKWSLVYYYRGDFREQVNLLSAHKDLAESLDDRAILGMFYAWYGFSIFCGPAAREKYKDSYEYLRKALEIGRRDQRSTNYWLCLHLAFLDMYGCWLWMKPSSTVKGRRRYQKYPTEHYLFFKSLGGIGIAYANKGNSKKALEAGTSTLGLWPETFKYKRHGSGASFERAWLFSRLATFPSAIEAYKKGDSNRTGSILFSISKSFP